MVPVVGVAERERENDHAADRRHQCDREELRPLNGAEPGRILGKHREQPRDDAAVEQERSHDDDRQREPPDHPIDDPVFRLSVADCHHLVERIEPIRQLITQSVHIVAKR